MITKRYITFLNFILGAVLVLSLGYLAWSLYRGWQKPEEKVRYSRAQPSEQTEEIPDRAYYEVIVNRNLWEAKFEPPVDKPPPTPKPAPVPPPQLKLVGTSLNIDSSRSRAIIEDMASRTQSLYRVGEEIRGARILEIHRMRVVLEHQGQRFVITSFPDSLPPPEVGLSLSRVLQRIDDSTWLVSKKGLWKMVNADLLEAMLRDGFIEIAVGDVIGALSTVGCRPYFPPRSRRRGAAEGYEVVVLPKNHLATHLGIRQGDIIRTVNGEVITDKKRAVELLQEVQGEARVVVELSRGGRELDLEYLIQEELLEPEAETTEGKSQ